MVIQLATLLLVSIYKQGMAVQSIDTPTRRYKTGRYIRIELYKPRREQVYIKLTIRTNLHEELRKVENNLHHYLLHLYFGMCVCVHTQTRVHATRERRTCKIPS